MSTPAAATSIRHEIVVQAPIARAFSVFTDDFGSFKPPEHNMLGVEIAETVFEPRAGGRVYDRGTDGTECHWARVLAYEPPDRVVISWDISPQWQIETNLAKTSEVEVRFIAEAPDRTRVELEHRNLDRHGDGWEAVRDGVAGANGWPLYLQRKLVRRPLPAPQAAHQGESEHPRHLTSGRRPPAAPAMPAAPGIRALKWKRGASRAQRLTSNSPVAQLAAQPCRSAS